MYKKKVVRANTFSIDFRSLFFFIAYLLTMETVSFDFFRVYFKGVANYASVKMNKIDDDKIRIQWNEKNSTRCCFNISNFLLCDPIGKWQRSSIGSEPMSESKKDDCVNWTQNVQVKMISCKNLKLFCAFDASYLMLFISSHRHVCARSIERECFVCMNWQK